MPFEQGQSVNWQVCKLGCPVMLVLAGSTDKWPILCWIIAPCVRAASAPLPQGYPSFIVFHREAGKMMPPLFAPGVSIRGEIASTGIELWAVGKTQVDRKRDGEHVFCWGRGCGLLLIVVGGTIFKWSSKDIPCIRFPFLSFINYETGFYFGDLADLKIPLAQPPSGGIMALFSLHSYLSSLKSLSACHFQSQIWLGNSRRSTQTSVCCFGFLAWAIISWLKLFPTTCRDFSREVVSGLLPVLCYVISLEPIHHNTFLLSLGGLSVFAPAWGSFWRQGLSL